MAHCVQTNEVIMTVLHHQSTTEAQTFQNFAPDDPKCVKTVVYR